MGGGSCEWWVEELGFVEEIVCVGFFVWEVLVSFLVVFWVCIVGWIREVRLEGLIGELLVCGWELDG